MVVDDDHCASRGGGGGGGGDLCTTPIKQRSSLPSSQHKSDFNGGSGGGDDTVEYQTPTRTMHTGATSDVWGSVLEDLQVGVGEIEGDEEQVEVDPAIDDVDAVTPWVSVPPQTWNDLAEEQARQNGTSSTTTTTATNAVSKRRRGRGGGGGGGNGGTASTTTSGSQETGGGGGGDSIATEEEAKRIRRVKNRASVEKCRTKQRQRLDRLNKERASLTDENELLRDTADQVRGSMQMILEQVAGLSGVNCRVII